MSTSTAVHVIGGLTLDAVLHPDGTCTTGIQGGNALWGGIGIQELAGGRPVIHSVVGRDYPPDALEKVADKGVSIDRIARNVESITPRVTFAYREDGSRQQPAPAHELTHLPEEDRLAFVDTPGRPEVRLANLPDAATIEEATGLNQAWHIGLVPAARFVELAAALRSRGVSYLQADCPDRSELGRNGEAVLAEHLHLLDAFLPSTSDTDVFAPGDDHHDLVSRFHDYGAPVVVLKRGHLGAIASDAATGERWEVPAYPAPVDGDPTGAGDVFCAVFAHARSHGASVLDAAVQASACASYVLEVSTPLKLRTPDASDFAARAAHIQERIQTLSEKLRSGSSAAPLSRAATSRWPPWPPRGRSAAWSPGAAPSSSTAARAASWRPPPGAPSRPEA